ncbi:DUF3631 domain-containing protein [Bradyrhizobium sp. McL0615]|uniref:DUF3631 domain-containing protein n=1 Tax=Bradyrhizobium sp. McL0615 TaxID=3415673 RepID=UPI003CE78698
MTKSVAKRFNRELLEKLCRQLGTDNAHEAEAARSRIDSLLQSFGKTWDGLVSLLGNGAVISIQGNVAADIAALGDLDLGCRTEARRRIVELLERHRKSWNDLFDALMGISPADWLSPSGAPEPERVKDLLGLLRFLLWEYVELQTEQEYTVVALWAIHTHVFSHFMVTPRLTLRSPVAGCGKTQLIDVLMYLAARADKFDSITPSTIFRLIDSRHPTLLIDEADNLDIQRNHRLHALFNSGHRHGGQFALVERRNGHNKVTYFSTFAPLLMALPDASGGLPRTLNSRCITLMMKRSGGRRELKRMDPRRRDAALEAAYGQILLWRNDVELDSDPVMPEGIDNRLADNWRPLLSIADNLGWGEEARKALAEFARQYQDADVSIQLLEGIRKVFGTTDRMSSQTLLEALIELDDADWSEFRGVRGDQSPHTLKAGEMALLLRNFGIRSRSIWPANRTPASKSSKGYLRQHFEEAWRRYCSDGTTAQSRKVNALPGIKSGTV